MASPMVEGRVDPHKKALFSLHISDRIAKKDGDTQTGGYSGVKYNHKPSQTTSTRTTTLTSSSNHAYALTLSDNHPGRDKDKQTQKDVFHFTGQKTPAKSTYVLVFDPSSQKATLEPLSDTYTFNLSTKNKTDISSTYPKIYPRKANSKIDGSQDNEVGDEELFDTGGTGDGETGDPDPDNPYDFRHFIGAVGGKEKGGNESEYNQSSPDYRTGTGSAMNTPLMGARKPVVANANANLSSISGSGSSSAKPKTKSKINVQPPKPRKRKEMDVDPLMSKKSNSSTAKKQTPQQSTPTVRLDRRASTHPKVGSSTNTANASRKAASKPAPVSSSKIKSAEIVHSSDDSDLDAEGSATSSPPRSTHTHTQSHTQRSPSPIQHSSDEDAYDNDNGGGGGLEIEVPDARPAKPRTALASLGLGQTLGLGGLGYLKSPDPARGPISLASAANSVEGSPDARGFGTQDGDTFDFGVIGANSGSDDDEDGYAEEDDDEEEGGRRRDRDGDVEPMDLGPPATTQTQTQSLGARKMSVGGAAPEEDEEDPLYKEMLEGLAGDSSEESEEE
ncbi:hypothetical protein K505DRAFT_404443 [Melanomma pulvis-pyrius CBS 109.77]|uniref:Transcription elongation factor Eaf N-terminal domain-containing protein n=1 Tax=Melanomma pulvis-pyrius CBS 109.77 TaxID=1314802 RepID=A0A6A6XVN1_9PLEO|nr:hypothetical protein K505DRAFT_404443 [Melanomma pulvis-pyrius CBS 109.77]